MQHERLQGLCTKIVNDQTEGMICWTSTGRLLHARGPAMARARSSMVEWDRQQNGKWNKTLLLQAIFSCCWRNKLRMDGCYCRCRQVEVRGKHSLETGQTVSLADA